jgi:urea transport system ATP-binding protein
MTKVEGHKGWHPVLLVEDLHLRFGGIHALRGLSFSVYQGELLAVIGPNGAGKSTLFNVISGFARPDSGRVTFRGKDLAQLAPHEISRLGIGRKFQVPNVFQHLTVKQNLVAATRGAWSVPALLCRAHDQLLGIEGFAGRVGLSDRLTKPAGELSHGEKQWLEIAMVLASGATLLLLDEPTAGMTLAETKRTESILRELIGTHTVIVIEHDIRFVREVADRVIVLHRGAVLTSGLVDDVEGDARVRDVYLGHTATTGPP